MFTSMKVGLVVVSLLLLSSVSSVIHENDDEVDKKFDDNFDVMWAEDHVKTSENGHVWHLTLDQISGSGFQSKHKYRFGWFSMKLKLVQGDSADVVTSYYVSF
ncbi:hypothetical protein SUGI_0563350 [Cryptomeria japonica]|nr:hypothetical protein SUGI_0563350 [Cryptomeria japonica]